MKSKFGLPADQAFFVPQEVYDIYHGIGARGAEKEKAWDALLASYAQKYPKEHAELTRRISGKFPQGWEQALPVYKPSDAAQASRKLSEIVLTALTPVLPDMMVGSADLTGSNLTRVKGVEDFQPPSTGLGSYKGTYLRYGVREHGMGAIANGLSAYGGILPIVATFLVSYTIYLHCACSDNWSRTSFHMLLVPSGCQHSANIKLSGLVSTWTLSPLTWRSNFLLAATHDSIGLGEDGPTHQPIETAIHFRATPNVDFWRPADGNETSAAYLVAIKRTETPSILSLSRQNLPNLENSTIEHASKGGYVVHEVQNEDLTIVSSGSEVSIALEAALKLNAEGIKTRVVSLPCWSVFDLQPLEYRLSVLRSGAPILSVEALTTVGWQKYSHEVCVHIYLRITSC